MRFYVYELRDENGDVFYVGKGSGSRIDQHEQRARRGVNDHKCAKIRAIWSRGGEVQKVVVFETEDEGAAFDEEIRLIAFYGRDKLTNKTDGGDGPSNPTPEVREKIARARRGRVASEETRELQRRAKLGTHRSPETKSKIAATIKGRPAPWAREPRSEEYRKNMSERLRGRKMSEDAKRKISRAKMGHVVTEETRRKISETKRRNRQ